MVKFHCPNWKLRKSSFLRSSAHHRILRQLYPLQEGAEGSSTYTTTERETQESRLKRNSTDHGEKGTVCENERSFWNREEKETSCIIRKWEISRLLIGTLGLPGRKREIGLYVISASKRNQFISNIDCLWRRADISIVGEDLNTWSEKGAFQGTD